MPVPATRYPTAPPRRRNSSAWLASVVAVLHAPSYGALCWILLWAAINTGPGSINLEAIGGSWAGFSNGVRATFPIAVLALWPFHLVLARRGGIRRVTLPERLWIFYGLVCLVASVYVEPWFDFAYWGFAWFGAFAASEIYIQERHDSLDCAVALNRLNWFLCSMVLVTVVWIGRGALLAETSTGISGYGINDRLPTVGGMPMVRATGIARLAAIPALLSFVWLWNTRGVARAASAAVLAPTLYLVWVMQSRGATVSFAFAVSFVLILMGGGARRTGLLLASLMVMVFLLDFIPNDTIHHAYLHATRGQEGQALSSMSGRSQIFGEVWRAIGQAPFIGYGPQADRSLTLRVNNAQDAFLYALLCGGFIGGSGFILGLGVTWVMLIRVLRRRDLLNPVERLTLIQTAGMLAFFTMRSYPENSTALYSVDLLVLLPAMVFIAEADRKLRRIVPVRVVRRAADYRERAVAPAAAFAPPR
jgi:O-antigen ligase